MKVIVAACLSLFAVFCSGVVFAQGKPYEGPDDPAGDIAWERAGNMNGNRILLYFENNTQIADYPRINTSKWPNDYTGTRMLDVVSVMIGGEVYLKNQHIPVTDPIQVAALSAVKEIDTLFYIQSSSFSSANMDRNYDGTVEWGFYPVPGYLNPLQDYPAMSNKPDSWPLKGWPSAGTDKKWQGEWDGRFGRGIRYADLETYFVANDAQDMEYIIRRNDPQERLITEGLRYYPRPDKVIGYNDPDVTIQRGYPWGGLGLRVAVRGFQWNNPEAKDMIFWEYNIANISDYDLITCGFGYFIDNSIGGDTGGDKEEGAFDDVLDLCYVWESIGVGEGGLIPGVVGIAYLESPGRPYDGQDNDEDGLIDEKRDNSAGSLIGPTDGIANLDNFLRFYHYKLEDLHPHYEGDEDQDWQDGYDKNGNGVYAYQGENGMWFLEDGEYPGDDVGLDGVGPLDINYNGPDEGECNHRPDYIEGVGCEPNFAAVDVSEADMIGLTSFALFDWPQWQSMNYFIGQDRTMWKLMDSHNLDTYIYSGGPGSVYEVFASTPFPFYKGRTERISMCIMFTRDNLATLRAPDHNAPKMFRLKETAQLIYERDYRFAQPPIMPKLRATPGDGKVILTWDDLSDKRTHEPFLRNVNDFEGYKVYRATDKMFSDAELITTGQGDKFAKVPIYQCDLIDHIQGYADYGIVEGVAYYLGDDTGIRHYFIDENVKNGITYYYAVVAYDYGIPEFGVSPTENNVVIELDEAEEIVRMGQNVAVVTPRPRAAGYISPEIVVDKAASSPAIPAGLLTPALVDLGGVKKNHTYEITFLAGVFDHLRSERYRHPLDGQLLTNGIQVWDVTSGKRQLVYEESPRSFPEDHLYYDSDASFWRFRTDAPLLTDIFDGIQLTLDMSLAVDSVSIDWSNSGWITGACPLQVRISPETKYFPYTYEIVFTGGQQLYQTKTSVVSQIRDIDGNPLRRNDILLNVSYPFYVRNLMSIDSAGEYEKLDLITLDLNGSGAYEWDQDLVIAGHWMISAGKNYWAGTVLSIDMRGIGGAANLPKPNDVFRLSLIRPLSSSDKFVFTVSPEDPQNAADIRTTMDSIKVVPNPYIATNEMEPAVANKYLNQRRRILFTHIPANCKIRIFTVSGVLVDEIEVKNEPAEGAVHWDLLSREGLEIAAGMYIFHVKSNVTGNEKIGKFAVIK